ncbi:hypothetical protein VCRA2119O147_1750006 [Vibrio crassostreae]|nr:hypothetical protein VCHA50P424_220037 [Vibrio chagasii]CAK1928481.1 hypothetical protein VCRA2119O47_240020 [Vibrio crassostreae]CAH7187962.1 hypothetical protein VCHA50O407_290023 [Vibrio chagasii]CAK1931115.1 hypothetical protein VCRA2113O20_240020 [Vibrio crassostreae]CAK1934239.1 hypothetical protein VCRA2113O322_210020 [Vibrio crassostreae]
MGKEKNEIKEGWPGARALASTAKKHLTVTKLSRAITHIKLELPNTRI